MTATDPRFGIVAAPPFVGWIHRPAYGWLASYSGQTRQEVLRELQRRHGPKARVCVEPLGTMPTVADADVVFRSR